MTVGCVVTVFYGSKAKANDRLVLLAIADEANDNGENAFPSIRTIAEKVNCHTDTVIECIKSLEALGELQVIRPERQGRGHFNRYKVLVENIGKPDALRARSARAGDRKSTDQTGYLRGSARANPSTDPYTDPRENPTRLKNQDPGCGECDNGWVDVAEGSVDKCKCQSEPSLRRVK